jgi:hypothetical protein
MDVGFVIKKIYPVTKIKLLQKNIRCFLRAIKQKPQINKIAFYDNYLFTKEIKRFRIKRKIFTKIRPHNNKLGIYNIDKHNINKLIFISKTIHRITPLIFIQRYIKNIFLPKHKLELLYNNTKLISKHNKHPNSMITKIITTNKLKKIILIQQTVKYFLYRIFTKHNAIYKQYILPMTFTKEIYKGMSHNQLLHLNKKIILFWFKLNYTLRKHFFKNIIRVIKNNSIHYIKTMKELKKNIKSNNEIFKSIKEENENEEVANFDVDKFNNDEIINNIHFYHNVDNRYKEGKMLKNALSMKVKQVHSLNKHLDSGVMHNKQLDNLSNVSSVSGKNGNENISPQKRKNHGKKKNTIQMFKSLKSHV